MVFVACGLSHKTAPINIREQVVLSEKKYGDFLHELIDNSTITEATILSTCNRLEIYCDTENPHSLIKLLAKFHNLPQDSLTKYFYIHHAHHGIRHILRVASGLDSMMIGELQILGQMRAAYKESCRLGTAKKTLNQIFEYVFKASKRIRSISQLNHNPISIASAAVKLVLQNFTNLNKLKILLIGSGETINLIAKYFLKKNINNFMIAGRNPEHTQALANNFNVPALAIIDLENYLPQADIIISATLCPVTFIEKQLIKQILQKRNNEPMFFLDLSVPRDIDENITQLNNITLYNIDDLYTIINNNLNNRKDAALHAERLIEDEINHYLNWHCTLKANTTIYNYRQHMQDLANKELKRLLAKLETGCDQQYIISEFSQRLINKLLHAPTLGLKQAAQDGRDDILSLIEYLYSQ